MILGICRTYHCLPSQLMAEDAKFLQLIMIENMGAPPERDENG